jgi:hypothetical protein
METRISPSMDGMVLVQGTARGERAGGTETGHVVGDMSDSLLRKKFNRCK